MASPLIDPALMSALAAGSQGQGMLAAPPVRTSMPAGAPAPPRPQARQNAGPAVPGAGGNFKNFGADFLNMAATHNYNAFNEGPQMRRQQYNQQQLQWFEQQKRAMELSKAQKAEQAITAQYEAWKKKRAATLKADPEAQVAPEMTEATWRSHDAKIRSRLMLGDTGKTYTARPAPNIQEYRLQQELTDTYNNLLADPKTTKKEIDRAKQNQYDFERMQRGATVKKFGRVEHERDPLTGKWKPITGGTTAEAAKLEALTEADRAAGITEAQKSAGYNIDMQAKLVTAIDSTELHIDRLKRFRDRVADGPATGRVEALSVAWDAEMQSLESAFLTEGWNKVIGMKESGFGFGNFTEGEFVRVLKTLGTIGNKREANLTQLDNAIKELEIIYGKWFERYENPDKFMDRKRVRRDFSKPAGTSRTTPTTSTTDDAVLQAIKDIVGG